MEICKQLRLWYSDTLRRVLCSKIILECRNKCFTKTTITTYTNKIMKRIAGYDKKHKDHSKRKHQSEEKRSQLYLCALLPIQHVQTEEELVHFQFAVF
jgi:hypothetical protein